MTVTETHPVSDRLDRVWAYLVPLVLVALAAALRLPDLATRGTWDGDQGHDMLVLRALVRDGVVPLLGPPTSIGDVHHGALYYYILAPAAALTGGDSPLAVVFLIAVAGIAAVAVTWWLARSIAGPVAGLVAGLAMAISPASIDESTFLWNPNLIGLSSAVALAGAWHAWTTRRARWWLLAAAGAAVTMQCHVLGVTLLPILGALFVADVRRRVLAADRRLLARVGIAGLALIALSFLPLVIHELTADFAEAQAALAYLRGGGESPSQGPVGRFLLIGTRVVSWPLVGLIVDGIAAAALSLVAVIAIAVWRSIWGASAGVGVDGAPTGGGAVAGVGVGVRGRGAHIGNERTAARWLGLGLLWTALALTFLAPSLAVVVRGLPNDHYHAFADPMVFVLVGIGTAALWRAALPPQTAARAVTPGRLLAVLGVVAIIAWAAMHLPPASHQNGGFPAAALTAERIEAIAGPGPIRLISVPDFKSVESYAYPLVRTGRSLQFGEDVGEATLVRPGDEGSEPQSLVVICDSLFEPVLGTPCGGPAESTVVPASASELVDRFDAAPGRVISIYQGEVP